MLQNNEEDRIWRFIRKLKAEVSFHECSIDLDSAGLFSPLDIQSNVEIIEQHFQLESSSDEIFENMTDAKLKSGVEMFFYLNSCTDLTRSWLLYYSDLFQNQSPNQIILALNRLLKKHLKTMDLRILQ